MDSEDSVAESRGVQVALLSLGEPRAHADPASLWEKGDSGCPAPSHRFGCLQKWSKGALETEKAPEITSPGLGHPEDHSSGKGLWELGPRASSLGLAPSSMPQFPSCLHALTLSTTSSRWVSRPWEAMSQAGQLGWGLSPQFL